MDTLFMFSIGNVGRDLFCFVKDGNHRVAFQNGRWLFLECNWRKSGKFTLMLVASTDIFYSS